VSHYEAPFALTRELVKVTFTLDDDQRLDGDGVDLISYGYDRRTTIPRVFNQTLGRLCPICSVYSATI